MADNTLHVHSFKADCQQHHKSDNPMLNILILKKTFTLLASSAISVTDIKNIRMVCSQWENHSDIFASHLTIKLGPSIHDVNMDTATRDEILRKYLPVNLFLGATDPERFRKFTKQAFTKFVVVGVDFSTSAFPVYFEAVKPAMRPNLWQYLDTMNSGLYSFGFEKCIFTELSFGVLLLQHLRTARCLILKDLIISHIPNELKFKIALMYRELGQKQLRFELVNVSGNIPIPRIIFFRYCKNVRHLIYSNYDNGPILEDLILSGLFQHHTLHKLDLKTCIPEADRVVCSKKRSNLPPVNIKLELLCLTLNGYDRNLYGYNTRSLSPYMDTDITTILHFLINIFQSSLKVLILVRPPIYEPVELDRSINKKLPLLEELHFYGNIDKSFSFLLETPNLKKLVVETHCLSQLDHVKKLFCPSGSNYETDMLKSYYKPYIKDMIITSESFDFYKKYINLLNMRELHMDCFMTEKTIELLGHCMPNLKHFKARISSAIWGGLCRFMSTLEEISVLRRSSLTDLDITGYDSSKYFEDIPRCSWNITCFKRLRRFNYNASCGQCAIGNISVEKGLLELPNLLEINLSASTNLDIDHETLLKQNIPIVNITRMSGELCKGTLPCCIETKFLQDMNVSFD